VARRTRRRRPSVQWLPTLGLSVGSSIGQYARPGGVEGTLQTTGLVTDTNQVIWDAFSLTYDYSFESTAVVLTSVDPEYQPSLQDLVSGNEYRLRRIVGKFFAHASSDELDSPAVQGAIVHAGLGFIISKTYDDGSPSTDFNEVNPLANNSTEDPWIWRRHWMLSPYGTYGFDNASDLRGNYAVANYPKNTAGYGSAVDGPHIDQKTARRIHRSERLFAVVAIREWKGDEGSACAPLRLDYCLDYRLLGSLMKGSAGNKRNASR